MPVIEFAQPPVTFPEKEPVLDFDIGVTTEPDGSSGGGNEIWTAEAAGDGHESPGCFFYSCFACKNGRCTVLNDTDFKGRPCPFFKTASQVKKGRQDAFDHLLIDGMLDIVNRYEEVYLALGLVDPEDTEETGLPVDDDIFAARAEVEEFRQKLMNTGKAGGDEDNSDDWDD